MIFVACRACRLWRRLPGLIFQSVASIRRCDGLGQNWENPTKNWGKIGEIMGEKLENLWIFQI
jgi:hypothetical protein